jgi:hypothetical protein
MSFGERNAGRTGTFKWDTNQLNGRSIEKLDAATIYNIKERLVKFRREVRDEARAKAPWKNQGARHRPPHYPGKSAREQLYSGIIGGPGSGLTLMLFHDQRTIWVGDHESFRYGISLEGGVTKTPWGQKQARPIIMPTLQRYSGDFMRHCQGALTDQHGYVPDDIDTS